MTASPKRLGIRHKYFAAITLAIALIPINAAICEPSDELGSLSGVVRDDLGKPIGVVIVTITGDATPPITLRTTTNQQGEYKFDAFPFGNYRATAALTGFTANVPEPIRLSTNNPSVRVDFTLTRQPSPTDATAATSPASKPPKFQAAGVRGLIDSGGYSAPANAAAAAKLIGGVADIKRSGNETGTSSVKNKERPCSLEPELKKFVAVNPDSADANRRLGEFYLAHDQPEKAIPLLEHAHHIDESSAAISSDLAEAWIAAGQFDAARGLQIGLIAQRESPEAHVLLARADEGSGLFTQASQEYELAAKTDPSEDNLFGVGYELILGGLPADAAKAFHIGVQKYPRSITLLIGVGVADFLQGHADESLLSFLKATDIDPADPRSYPLLSSASSSSGAESDRVRASFKRFLDLRPDNAQANYFYALDLMAARATAVETDNDAASARSSAQSSAQSSARSSSQSSAPADSIRVETLLKRAVQLDSNFAEAHLQLGSLYSRRGEYERAVPEFEVAVGLVPSLKEAHYRLALAYRHVGRTELAAHEMKLFQEARERQVAPIGNESIQRFISVLNRSPEGSSFRSGSGTPCPDRSH